MTPPHETVMSATTIEPTPGVFFSVAYSRRWPGPSIDHIAHASVPAIPSGETPLQCAASTNQPSTCLPGLEEKAREPHKLLHHQHLQRKQRKLWKQRKQRKLWLHQPVWTQFYPSRPVVPVRLVPHSIGDEWHCHCSCSCHSCRRASLWAEKNQQSGSTSDSLPNATQGSPVTTCNSSPLAPSALAWRPQRKVP